MRQQEFNPEYNLLQEIFDYVNNRINKERYEIVTQKLIGSFVIDILIYDKMTYQYKLGIECVNKSNENEVTNNIYKQRYLDVRGWNIYWLWQSEYLLNKEITFQNLENIISDYSGE